MSTNQTKIRPQYVVYGLLFAAILLHFIFKPKSYVTPPFNYIGLFFIIDGGSLVWWSRRTFQNSGTPVSEEKPPARLITEGIYTTIRHPMYVGSVIVCAGIWVLIGSWPFLAVPLALFVIFDRIYIPREEKIMEERFGEEYVLYKKSTRRWLYRII